MLVKGKVSKLVLGAMEFGRRCSLNESQKIVSCFLNSNCSKYNCNEIDTAFMFNKGESERFLGEMDLEKTNAQISTTANARSEIGLSFDTVISDFSTSLKRLNRDKIDMFMLCSPDVKSVPLKDTMEAINTLYEQGKIERFGVSNYSQRQVEEIYEICIKNNFIKPSVYQGMYNVLTRRIEEELLPLLNEFNIGLYIYNPLAGGILTGKYKFDNINEQDKQQESRFFGQSDKDPSNLNWNKAYRDRYWHESYFNAMNMIQESINGTDSNISILDAAFSWLLFHSNMNDANNNAIMLGVSSVHQLESNIEAIMKAKPLHEDIVATMDQAWQITKDNCPGYTR